MDISFKISSIVPCIAISTVFSLNSSFEYILFSFLYVCRWCLVLRCQAHNFMKVSTFLAIGRSRWNLSSLLYIFSPWARVLWAILIYKKMFIGQWRSNSKSITSGRNYIFKIFFRASNSNLSLNMTSFKHKADTKDLSFALRKNPR